MLAMMVLGNDAGHAGDAPSVLAASALQALNSLPLPLPLPLPAFFASVTSTALERILDAKGTADSFLPANTAVISIFPEILKVILPIPTLGIL